MPIALISNEREDEVLQIHTDHLQTPKVITDKNGTVLWQWETEAFGSSKPKIETIKMPLRMAGQYADDELGLFYNYYRFYDPNMGRYIENDPIGLEGGLNVYGYVGGSPLHKIDPTGEFGFLALAPLAGGAGLSISGATAVNIVGATISAGLGIAILDKALDKADEDTCDKNKCEKTYYHYTNYENFQLIVNSGYTIRANSKGLVYLTPFAYSPNLAEQALFMGARNYKGKGNYVIKMKIRCDTPLVGGTQPNELIHYGSLRLGKQITKILYAGSNTME